VALFASMYDRVMLLSKHRAAPRWLFAVSFTESFIFPIPPDVMLAPMSLAKPNQAFLFALITTIASVLGGVLGYLLGYFAIESALPFIEKMGYLEAYNQARGWFSEWGYLAIFAAGFSPIPYKIFTVTAGAVQMSFAPFVLASLVGRGARFFLVAALMRWGGAPMEDKLKQYVEVIGWSSVLLLGTLYAIHKF
jgi:membrane protein YqaA with SNARE-associated domain